MSFINLRQRIFNVPVAIAPEKAEIILSAISGKVGIAEIHRADGSTVNMMNDADYGLHGAPEEPEYMVMNDIAVVPVTGTLVHKSSWLNAFSGMTSYAAIRKNYLNALKDRKVKGIVFDIDSPGGEVSGCFDLVDMIHRNKNEKPTMAILSECAFSAAYAVASATDCICVPRSGGTGSVGVVAMHVDYSERLEKEGMKVTLIHYGAKKVDGNETQPLSSSALKKLQSEVDRMGELFVKTVARNRGLTAKAVRETEAGIFMGKDGVDIGFADQVLAPEEAFEMMSQLIA